MGHLISMGDPDHANIDLGRPITWMDIVDDDVQPMLPEDAGCTCYVCQRENPWDTSKLQPLTPSSGVFTLKVRCGMDSPVWVCLDHIPFHHDQFEAFRPEVAEELRRLKANRYKAISGPSLCDEEPGHGA